MKVWTLEWLRPFGLTLGVALGFSACNGSQTSTAPDQPAPGGGGGRGGGGGSTSQPLTTTIPKPTTPGSGGPALNEHCGVGDCIPDDADSCNGEPEPAGGAGGVAGTAGAPGQGGAPTASGGSGGGGSGGGDAGAAPEPSGGTAGELEGGSAGTSEPEAPAPPQAERACRVVVEDDELVSACGASGSGRLDAPCLSTADCSGGFACVGDGLVGRCRPYCCRTDVGCDSQPGTYCSLQPERAAVAEDADEPLIVPVCVPADDCDLDEPFPCTAPRECECPDGKACMVVRSDRQGNPASGLGMTACVEPGRGRAGDACPCDYGHVCSAGTGTCLELCSLASAELPCAGHCQASAELPLGWGVCIGP